MPKLKVALAQMRCEKGDWEGNLARTEELMREASAAGCDVVVFPEMGLSGYNDPSRYPDALVTVDSPQVQRFVDMTAKYNITASGGFTEANPNGKPFITQIVARNGEVLAVYHKNHVVDEEAEWFTPGEGTVVFDLPLGDETLPVGVAVCADSENPAIYAYLAAKGARVVFHSSAPGLYTRRTDDVSWQDGYNWYKGFLAEQLPVYAREHGLHVAVATQTGATIDEDFPGGTFVYGPDGSTLAEVGDWHEKLLIYTIEL